MNSKKINDRVKFILGLILVVIIFGFAGRVDWTEEVIYNMPDSTYQEIKEKLSVHGNKPTDYDIAKFYINHYGK